MKKVFQAVVDSDRGDCMRAAVASLLEMELNDVPNFIEQNNKEFKQTVFGYLYSKGFDATAINRRRERDTTEFLQKVAKFDGGYKGYFYASVPSQSFPDRTHAVVVDTDLNVVHDPNPDQMAMKLTPDDVDFIIVMNPMIIGKTGKLFTREEWNNASKEEKDENTHKVTL